MKHTANILLACCFAVVALHIWGALQPSYVSWGFNLYSFYDAPVLWISLFCLLAFCVPQVQSRILGVLSKLFQRLSRLPKVIPLAAVVLAVCAAGTLYAAQLHLLGDGALLLRSLSSTVWDENITQSFNNQPLLYRIFREALEHHIIDSPLNTYDLYIGINRVATAAFFIMVFWGLSKPKLSLLEKVLIGCLLFFNAGTQFFFGYIENYVLQYVTTGFFVLTGWLALERRVDIVIPILFFCADLGLHMGNIVFLPALIVLLLFYFKEKKIWTISILGGLGIAGFAGIYSVGYLPAFMHHFSSESVDFLHLFTTGGGNFPYPMFSWIHLLDWFNLTMLVVPLGLALGVILLIALPKDALKGNPTLLFLLAAAFCGLLFTWVVNSALGLVRDWDLQAGFFVPLLMLDAYLLLQTSLFERRQYVLAVVAAVLIFHWVPWIGINADAALHLRRAEMLNVPQLLSPSSQLFYDEALANYLYDHQMYAEAKKYYEHYMSIEPRNPRIVGNISDVYRKSGDKEKYFNMLKYGVSLNTKDPGIYSNLGVEYASRGDTNKAIEYNLKALEIDPNQDKAHANLGVLYASKGDYRRAQQYFEEAIGLGMTDPMLYKYTADLDFFLGDYAKAVQYYSVYLSSKPGDERAQNNRRMAEEALKSRQPS